MYTIERFYCASLPVGAIAFGWYTIVYSIITAILCIFQGSLTALFFYTFLGVGSGVLLLLGVRKSLDILLLPWLGFNAFHIVIVTPFTLITLLFNHLSEPGVFIGSVLYLAIYTIFICYGWIGVFSLYLKYKNGESPSTNPRGQV
ncbi:uncharacterized protein LOC129952437 [Eupeodes corollae]|uniref:uncharacterized protein LOC129952437 n=1 Tax=Eupeodes corollae TaxID=290404 RepID=UPI002490A50D|nr:uncharacterized protein LOC129952437 [Eupeodes corollae]